MFLRAVGARRGGDQGLFYEISSLNLFTTKLVFAARVHLSSVGPFCGAVKSQTRPRRLVGGRGGRTHHRQRRQPEEKGVFDRLMGRLRAIAASTNGFAPVIATALRC